MQKDHDEQWQDGNEVFYLLHNQKLIQAQKHPPEGFYIKGIIEESRFVPQTEVLGMGELAKSGRYGWLELNTREFFAMESEKKAITPFVKGYMTERGFLPSLRMVFNEP